MQMWNADNIRFLKKHYRPHNCLKESSATTTAVNTNASARKKTLKKISIVQ